MKVLFLFISSLFLGFSACSSLPQSTFQVVRECETTRRALKKCVVHYRAVPSDARYYNYYFRSKELKTSAFQFLQNQRNQE